MNTDKKSTLQKRLSSSRLTDLATLIRDINIPMSSNGRTYRDELCAEAGRRLLDILVYVRWRETPAEVIEEINNCLDRAKKEKLFCSL